MPVRHSLVARARRSWWVPALVVLAIALPVVVTPGAPAGAVVPPQFRVPGFSFTRTDTDLPQQLMDFTYLPSGRILAIGKTGFITQGLFGVPGWTNVTFNGQPQLAVVSNGDRGLTGVSLAPDFASTGHLYLLYNYQQSGCAPAETPAANGKNNVCGRLSRWTVDDPNNPHNLSQEQVLVQGMPAFSAYGVINDYSHTVGTVIAAPDNTIFFGTG
ncbi:MAG TPA: PQQ-dependent sugar dehydrogenase, partial [Acidimicrobiales bacterium]